MSEPMGSARSILPTEVIEADSVYTERFLLEENNRHDITLASIFSPPELADYIQEQRACLIKLCERPKHPPATNQTQIPRFFSDLMDATLKRMFWMACASVGIDPIKVPLAIAATGGYGRRELAPYSDIDITFIAQRDGDTIPDKVVRELFRLVMDVFIAKCGLDVGYAYRLFSDCWNLDHQTASGLLDVRFIAGSNRLFIQFEDAYWAGFNATEFVFTKIEERLSVLKKQGSLVRVVEPNLKEGAGGIRDLHTAIWLVQAREQLSGADIRGDKGIVALGRELNLSPCELAELRAAKSFVFDVRNALHIVCSAARDQLVVTRQEDVARRLGYSGDQYTPPVETMMAGLYPHLETLRRMSDKAIRHVGNGKLMLSIGLDCEGREITRANSSLLLDDPVWLIWACELAQRYSLTISDGTITDIRDVLQSRREIREKEEAALAFSQILMRPGRCYSILQQMADLGVLDWYLPEFAGLMNLIPYDASHDYTIGQHSLLVAKNLDEFASNTGTHSEEVSEVRRTITDLPHPEYLYLAALIHDAGKAQPGLPHAETSALLVPSICKRLHWTDEAAESVAFLVRHHLLMDDTARLKDLTMDRTIRDFTSVVDDADHLNMLYLLSCADTKAVGEGIWTPVKAKFLRELWLRAGSAIFSNEELPINDQSTSTSIASARRRLKKNLTLEKFDSEEIEEHIEAMPPYYLLNSAQQDVALHLNFVRQVRNGEIVVDFHDVPDANLTELSICTFDDPQPGLLSKIAGVLLGSSITVHSARVLNRATLGETIALDTLLVDFRGRPLTAGKRLEIGARMNSILSGVDSLENLLGRFSTPAATNTNEISLEKLTVNQFEMDLDDGISQFELRGLPSLALFYRVTSVVSGLGWNIQSAKLSSTKAESIASLYVTGVNERTKSRAVKALETALAT